MDPNDIWYIIEKLNITDHLVGEWKLQFGKYSDIANAFSRYKVIMKYNKEEHPDRELNNKNNEELL